MEQEKIGKFIAQCRKNRDLTQAQLAEKLNITDRAISKWETGKGMPDSSIMLQLCDELQISVNELLKGEHINNNDIHIETDKNIINILEEYKRMKKRSNIFKTVSTILLAIIIFGALSFGLIEYFKSNDYSEVDISQEEENELYDKCLEYFINMQSPHLFNIENKEDKPNYDVSISDFKVFAKLQRIGIIRHGKEIEVYCLITDKSYHVENEKLKSDSGGETVCKAVFENGKMTSFEEETIAIKLNKFLPTQNLYKKYVEVQNNQNVRKEIDKEVKEYYSYILKEEDINGITKLEIDTNNISNSVNIVEPSNIIE